MDLKRHKFCNIDIERLYPRDDDSSELAVICRPDAFSASEICRAVEDCDAHVVNLNVTSDRTENGDLVVVVRVNRRGVESIVRSIERFGYVAVPLTDDASDEDFRKARDRVNELLRYLEI